jgi:hypothetical protein
MDAETEEDEQTRTVAEEGESILDVASLSTSRSGAFDGTTVRGTTA